jgi:sugar phosphate isomerase/epimerase
MKRLTLNVQQSWWSMGGLGSKGKEWSTEERFEKIAEAGYSGIAARLPAPQERESWQRLLEKYRFSFGVMTQPRSSKEIVDTLHAAAGFGPVSYVNAQVMDAFLIGDEAIRLLEEILEASERARIPVYIETHRGTVTQDLQRTVDYCSALRCLPLTIDLSHYVVAGELNGTSERAEAYFDQLLGHTACIHARVSDGEKIQVDVGPDGDHPMVKHFQRWWRKAMTHWAAQAKPGDALPFVTELGPPGGYAITRRDEAGNVVEISDRWQQAQLFKRMAEALWAEVTADMK